MGMRQWLLTLAGGLAVLGGGLVLAQEKPAAGKKPVLRGEVRLTDEARRIHREALVIDGHAYHINFGADLSALK